MNRSVKIQARKLKLFFNLALGFMLIVVIFVLANPSFAVAESPLIPQGTAQENVFIWLPENSVDLPVLATADYQGEDELPAGLTYPAGAIGPAFTFGLWQGEDIALKKFDPSIVLNVKYQDVDVAALASGAEEKLQLLMYDPATDAWVKTCSSVNVYVNTISAALASITPFEDDNSKLRGSALMVLAVDDTPPLMQSVDEHGVTTISTDNSDMTLQVPPGTVEIGSHFEMTVLPNLTGSQPLRVLSRPVAAIGCKMDYNDPTQNNRQITHFPSSFQVSFNYDLATLSRAGGQANLTLVELQGGQWVDLEELGFRIVRGRGAISVDTTHLGTFSLAAR